jgi:4-hydroxy-3-methylbut-2-enyl diphosphate reductase IspH
LAALVTNEVNANATLRTALADQTTAITTAMNNLATNMRAEMNNLRDNVANQIANLATAAQLTNLSNQVTAMALLNQTRLRNSTSYGSNGPIFWMPGMYHKICKNLYIFF